MNRKHSTPEERRQMIRDGRMRVTVPVDETKHTPTPWSVQYIERDGVECHAVLDADGDIVCLSPYAERGPDDVPGELVAVARLTREVEALRWALRAVAAKIQRCESCDGTGLYRTGRESSRSDEACRVCGGIGEVCEAGDCIADVRKALDCPRCEHPSDAHYISRDGRQVFCHQCDCNVPLSGTAPQPSVNDALVEGCRRALAFLKSMPDADNVELTQFLRAALKAAGGE